MNIYNQEYHHKYYKNHKDEILKRQKEFRLKNRDKINKSSREYYSTHQKEILKRAQEYYHNDPDRSRNRKLQKAYGITQQDYVLMLVQQNGVCAICGSNNNGKALHIDHDHKTGKVRALLCAFCNHGLGYIENSIWIKKAQSYLNQKK